MPDAIRQALESYQWPGNVRELKNFCEYLAARTWGRKVIELDDLTPGVRRVSGASVAVQSSYEMERRSLEREQIEAALRKSGGKIIHAARLLGMNRNTLSQRIKEHGITRESFRVDPASR
jgi:transcriptional regulator of acetoin/glycerol metabolism